MKKGDYYSNSTGRKVGDFFLGLIGVYALSGILWFGFYLLALVFNSAGGGFSLLSSLIWVFICIGFLLVIIAIIFGFKKNRRYISIGIITAIVLPLLVFGACLGLIFGSGDW